MADIVPSKPPEGVIDAEAWARKLGISREALDLYLSCDVVDLHLDTFIWTRVFGYDPTRRHGRGPLGARYFSQVDLPRLREARIAGAIWSVTTNPFRRRANRPNILRRNMGRLRSLLDSRPNDVLIAQSVRDFREAKKAGKHAAFVGIQGGNALEGPGGIEQIERPLIKVTLVHLTRSSLGESSSPIGRTGGNGLTPLGREIIQRLDEKRIFVDLAHISRKGFFEAVKAHDRSRPLLVSHTGVAGVHNHWRNVDDEQIRAVADTGGAIGVMYQSGFLGGPPGAARIVDHVQHIVEVAGEDFASLGSDWDGMILPPRDMPTCLELPRLVQFMLDRRWTEGRIRKIMGGNFLRALALLDGDD